MDVVAIANYSPRLARLLAGLRADSLANQLDAEIEQRCAAEERARLRALRNRLCGAKTRAGHSCKRKGLGRGGRCPNHGGASTGPTAVGRERIAEAQRKRWKAWRERRDQSFGK